MAVSPLNERVGASASEFIFNMLVDFGIETMDSGTNIGYLTK